jgi:hypothetical protein
VGKVKAAGIAAKTNPEFDNCSKVIPIGKKRGLYRIARSSRESDARQCSELESPTVVKASKGRSRVHHPRGTPTRLGVRED